MARGAVFILIIILRLHFGTCWHRNHFTTDVGLASTVKVVGDETVTAKPIVDEDDSFTFEDVLREDGCGKHVRLMCSTCNDTTQALKPRPCYCDAFCLEMGDCCINYFEMCLKVTSYITETPNLLHNDTMPVHSVHSNVSDFENPYSKLYVGDYYTCERMHGIDTYRSLRIANDVTNIEYYNVISICPKHPSGGSYDNVVLCEETSNNETLLQMVPVLYENKLYKNKYCVLCHHAYDNIDIGNYYSLVPLFRCNQTISANILNNTDKLAQVLFQTCDMYFDISDLQALAESRGFHYYCPENWVDKCDKDHKYQIDNFNDLEYACQSHAAPIEFDQNIYKNRYCALCNSVDEVSLENSKCYNPKDIGEKGINDIIIPPSSFSILLSFSGQRKISYGSSHICSKELEVLDIVNNECVSLSCTLDQMLLDNVCEMKWNQSVNSNTSVDMWLTVAIEYDIDEEEANIIAQAVSNKILFIYTPCFEARHVPVSVTDCSDFGLANMSCVRIKVECDDSEYGHAIMAILLARNDNKLVDSINKKIGTSFPTGISSITLTTSTKCNLSDADLIPVSIVADWEMSRPLNDIYEDESKTNIYNAMEDVYFMFPELGIIVPPQTKGLAIQVGLYKNTKTGNIEKHIAAGICASDVCFRTLNTDVANVYKMVQNTACIQVGQGPSNANRYDNKSILTTVTVSVSIVSLCALLVIHYFNKSLCKRSGVYLVNITLSLLVAQTLFLASTSSTVLPELCTAVAIAQHYFWLASFVWSAVLAVSLYKRFASLTAQDVPDVKRHCRLAVIWCVPGFIVVLTVGIEVGTELPFQYGDSDICWIRGGTALALSFGLPVAFILVLNFTLAVKNLIIIKATRSSIQNIRDKKTDHCYSDIKDMFIISIRMSIMMGFPWILGFISNIKALSFIEYGFIVLNGLQGFFILVAFLSSDKGRKLFKSKKQLPGTSLESSNTKQSDLTTG